MPTRAAFPVANGVCPNLDEANPISRVVLMQGNWQSFQVKIQRNFGQNLLKNSPHALNEFGRFYGQNLPLTFDGWRHTRVIVYSGE